VVLLGALVRGVRGADGDLRQARARGGRTAVIIVVLGGFVYATGKWSDPLALAPTPGFLVLSGVATGASWVCYFRALEVGDASFLGERPTAREWVGILMVAAGVLILGFKR